MYGGMKLLQHWSYSSQSHAGTWVLDGESYMWYTGYLTNGQVPGMYSTLVITQLDLFHNSKNRLPPKR